MEVFELIKLVLDDEYAGITGDKDAAIKAELVALGAAYARLTDPTIASPSYDSPVRRFAYIYKYTTCHANIVAEKIAMVPELHALFVGNSWLNVSCIGGGPGNDFLGIVKHMIKAGSAVSLKAFLLDKEPSWGDSWANVEQQAEGLSFRVSTHSQVLDVLHAATWMSQTRYRQADLFTFVYFVSEVWRLSTQAAPYFTDLFASARSGSLFLFIDNNDRRFHGYFDDLATGAGLSLIAGTEEPFMLDFDEQKSDLEPYYSKFAHSPKITASISWRVYRKH